ncbi:helix-turn-helix transcriptional regulator [Bacillus sp. ISL-35]|uniref:helix-turn-helix transcriptional regulator n=1 Tax=Bacillus sp. ISL-35 TaxID=2819122 RepID=UPI001BE89B3E|nr:helix-turn-helix transcriptional regulator [Bacillus sp. ISL-35]MBT2679268.1 helix-turn-helix transcriptional regulator [Bacillus sp. ISL-35]MBT2703164.1 helix-turn-helix transcriptional regulator [Chryseobacterium sp. ISL-80]
MDHEQTKQTIFVGKIIEKLRREQLLNQEDLADLSNKDRRTISNLERDQYKPSLETFFNLAASLELKPDELMKVIYEVKENQEFYNAALKEVLQKKVILKKKRNAKNDE